MKEPSDVAFEVRTGVEPTCGSSPSRVSTQLPLHTGEDQGQWFQVRVTQPVKAWYRKIVVEFLLQQKLLLPSKDGRHITLDSHHGTPLIDERTGRPYVSNSIRSSRYTIWDFLPKQLVFQCTRLSNFYFIAIGIPQAIPGISPVGSFTNILPVFFFILLEVAKEGYDDFRRYRLDKVENLSTVKVLGGRSFRRKTCTFSLSSLWDLLGCSKVNAKESGTTADILQQDATWTTIQWRDITVGDIVKLERDDAIPADVVLLQVNGGNGSAFVETMALDGETSLKNKRAPTAVASIREVSELASSGATVVAEDPNPNLYDFNGRMTIQEKAIPLGTNEVVYRGSVLRNTESVIGVVINTGEECKIRMNANHHPKAKTPRLESYSNQIVISLVVYVILLSLGCTIGYLRWQNSTEEKSWYLDGSSVTMRDIVLGFFIEFNNVIPLALYISLEIVKLGQMWLVNNDVEMYDEISDTPMRCNTNTILEDCGQVSFILSDKTGTLTENEMKFRKMSVAGRKVTQDSCLPESGDERNVSTSKVLEYLRGNPSAAFSKQLRQFILGMALCHTCLPERKNDSLSFQGSSPDEVALVEAALELGCSVTGRTAQSISLRWRDSSGVAQDETYEILDIVEFSSKRKRMSIVIRCPDGRLWLICKGADSIILPRLKQASAAKREVKGLRKSHEIEHEMLRRSIQLDRASCGGRHSLGVARPQVSRQSSSLDIRPAPIRSLSYGARKELKPVPALPEEPPMSDESAIVTASIRHIDAFATEGLRTLVFAHKHLSLEEYITWKKIYNEAETALTHRQERIEAAAEQIEQRLDFLGVTAIEDKLQKDVPQTIDKLRRANIKIWMLTGDKRETAVNIAHSARICRPESDVIIVDSKQGNLEGQLRSVAEELCGDCVHSVVVIDGQTLAEVEADSKLHGLFYSLIPRIDSVICCRASPSQKAGIVKAIRSRIPKALTLAIGDGANDIAMIQASVSSPLPHFLSNN
jgi:phospholipid-translocating ATPase